MPDFWSHHFAAKKANEKRLLLNPKVLIWSTNYDNIFTFGAQGPDFFYYINKFNPITKHRYGSVGNQVHELETRDLFREMLTFLIKMPSEALMAYISGFISHYIMDVYCHPLICALGPDSTSHKRVELDLEAFCLHDYWDVNPHTLSASTLRCSDEVLKQSYVPLWQHLLSSCYHTASIEARELMQGHHSMLKLQNILINDTLSKLPFISALSKVFHYDLTALRYPNGDDIELKALRDYETFQLQYEKGIEETVKALVLLDQVVEGTMTIERFIEAHIKFDFLGEA